MISEEKKRVLELFAEGRKYYIKREFSEALKCFAKAIKIDPEDGPSKVFFKRSEYYIKNPPPEEWDGIFIMITK